MRKKNIVALVFLSVLLGVGFGMLAASLKPVAEKEAVRVDAGDEKPEKNVAAEESKEKGPVQKNVQASEEKKEALVPHDDDLGLDDPFDPELDDAEPEEDPEDIIEDPEMEDE